jgi:hypothetical protein
MEKASINGIAQPRAAYARMDFMNAPITTGHSQLKTSKDRVDQREFTGRISC